MMMKKSLSGNDSLIGPYRLFLCGFIFFNLSLAATPADPKMLSSGDTAIISRLLIVSDSLTETGNFTVANDTLKYARERISVLLNATKGQSVLEKKLQEFIGKIEYGQGHIFFVQHHYKEALPHFENASNAFKVATADGWLAMSLITIGNIYSEQSDYKLAQLHFNRAMDIYLKTKDKNGLANCYNALGNMAIYQSNYPDAHRHFLNSLKLRESSGDRKGIASSNNNLGTVAYYMENYDEALRYFRISLAIKESLGDKTGVADLYKNIGSVYGNKEMAQTALEYFEKSLAIHTSGNNKSKMAQLFNNLGVIHTSLGNYNLARKNLEASLKITSELGNEKSSANTLSNLAGNYYKEGNYKKALAYYQESTLLSEKSGNLNAVRENLLGISKTYAAVNNYKLAYESHQDYLRIKDSLVNSENSLLIAEMKKQLETEKKDKEIMLLGTEKKLQEAAIEKQQTRTWYLITGFSLLAVFAGISMILYNQKRKTAFERQVSEVKMTALRAQMNPHFIFNSLNSINKYIQIKEQDLASEYLVKFSKLMRLILENSGLQEVTISRDLQALELYMQLETLRMNNRFSYEIRIAQGIDPEVTLIPPLLLQPFVENAIWHGLQHKREDGKIKIGISSHDDMLVCSVEDNGIGRKKAAEIKSASPMPQGESLGMKITQTRIEILNKTGIKKARIALNDLDEGFRIEFFLPLEQRF